MLKKNMLCALLACILVFAGAGCTPANTVSTSLASSPSPSYTYDMPATPEVLDFIYTPAPRQSDEPQQSDASQQGDTEAAQTQSIEAAQTEAEQSTQGVLSADQAQSQTEQGDGAVHMRAVWVASVLNMDFPSADSRGDEAAQRAEIITILDNTLSWNLDTVIMQVRPMGDALYRSAINPWSSFLTGTQGQDPGWDPLEFAIQEAHSRGLSLHVWLNPYRVTHPSASFTVSDLAEGSLAKQHPEWLIEYDNVVQYDPAREEVKQHIVDTVQELVDNYDVDGVHFDDYFYPSGYPLPDGAERDGVIDRERREHVNDMLRRVSAVCKAAPHKVIFGVSPFGIWKNSSSDPNGSNTSGNESYYAMAADSVRWIQEGIIDYIAPQLYWPVGHARADYDTLLHWWADQTRGTSVSLIIGQGIYSEDVAADIQQELDLNATVPEVTGSIFFNYSTFLERPNVAETVRSFYAASRN